MKRSLLLCLIGLASWIILSATELNWDKKQYPDLRFSLMPLKLNCNLAFGAFVEAGPQTVRANGTFGTQIFDNQLFKLSGEYLSQKLGFQFESGRTHRWVSQGALGIAYALPCLFNFVDFADIGFIYSHSMSRHLPFKMCKDTNEINYRSIAGSNSYGILNKVTWSPWEGGFIQARLSYDWVYYRGHYSHSRQISGLGGGIELNQLFFRTLNLHLGVSVQSACIFYNAAVSLPASGLGSIGGISLFAEHVQGRHGLPNSSRIGLDFGLFFGSARTSIHCYASPPSELEKFTSIPAVYMPSVLVIKDEKCQSFCEAPTVVRPFEVMTPSPGPFTFEVSSYFGGAAPLIFGALNLPTGFSIDPVTGVITGVVDGSVSGEQEILIYATNACGRIAQTLIINFPI